MALAAAATRRLAVHSEPRRATAELGTLLAGQEFEPLGNHGAWWYVRAGRVQGFVDARYTCCMEGDRQLWTTRVAIDALSMRDRPALGAATLRLLEQDELLTVHGFFVAPGGDVWLRAARDSLTGYVSADRTCCLPPGAPMTRAETLFVRRLLLAARQSQRDTGTPVSVTLAQAIVESNWGLSAPSEANNPLHIRAAQTVDGCYAWGPLATGYLLAPAIEWRDGRTVVVEQAFRTYSSLHDGLRDHGLMLRTDPRFTAAFSLWGAPLAFAGAIGAAGYSSDPDYVDKLVSKIETYRLVQYDR